MAHHGIQTSTPNLREVATNAIAKSFKYSPCCLAFSEASGPLMQELDQMQMVEKQGYCIAHDGLYEPRIRHLTSSCQLSRRLSLIFVALKNGLCVAL